MYYYGCVKQLSCEIKQVSNRSICIQFYITEHNTIQYRYYIIIDAAISTLLVRFLVYFYILLRNKNNNSALNKKQLAHGV